MWQASAALSMASSVQASAFGGPPAGYIADHVDAGVLLHQIDARARALDLAADGGRHRDPAAVRACEIFDRRIDLAVELDQLGHDVVDRLEMVGVRLRLPGREGEDVVPGSRLRFGGDGQQVLVALRGDVVDRDLDLVLLAPFLAQRLRGIVGAGHPMVPEADRQLAGGVGAAHIRHRDRRGGGGCRQETASRHLALEHDAILHGFPARTPPVLCSLLRLRVGVSSVTGEA